MLELNLALHSSTAEPLFLQIVRGITEAIQQGRLGSGDKLPGSRRLAKSLGVHRNTVLAAFDELVAQGWLLQSERSGTFVNHTLPEVQLQQTATLPGYPTRMGFAFHPIAARRPQMFHTPPGELVMAGGWPEVRYLPLTELSRAYRRALGRHGQSLLSYGDPAGHPALRQELARMVAQRRGLSVTTDNVVLTHGAQMGIFLAAQLLVRPGDVVAVERFGYPPAWTALRTAGAHLEPLPVDEQGLCVDSLERLLQRMPVRAVYLTPHHQFPTLAVMGASRRMRLLELARQHRFALIEDDYDNEFHYEGQPVLPLASADTHGVVVYIGTLSKVLAPGLRAGFVIAPAPFCEAMVALRGHLDRQGNQVQEVALASLFEEGLIERHIRKMRKIYKARRDHLHQTLQHHLPKDLSYDLPRGGLAIWARVHEPWNAVQWSQKAKQQGVHFETGESYVFDQSPQPFLRLGFARLNEEELTQAVTSMKKALDTMRPTSKG
ncbi:MAG: PLP-dependent aminotransferase family protein [Deltaproteobacteria bacterium]|nr:MAG: PLP-dependent aminotransferase family protein [Deltaproteobacteria bacterium]